MGKKLRLLLPALLLAATSPVAAQTADKPADVTTLLGKTYKQARVFRVEPDGITYMYAGGMSKIPFTQLPEAIRQQYGYDRAKASAFSAQDAAEQNQLASAQAASAEATRTRNAALASQADAEKDKAASDKAAIAASPNFTGAVLDKHKEGLEVQLKTKTYEADNHQWGGEDGIIFLRGYPD